MATVCALELRPRKMGLEAAGSMLHGIQRAQTQMFSPASVPAHTSQTHTSVPVGMCRGAGLAAPTRPLRAVLFDIDGTLLDTQDAGIVA